MADETPNLGLTKPAEDDDTIVREDFNSNMDKIDAAAVLTVAAATTAYGDPWPADVDVLLVDTAVSQAVTLPASPLSGAAVTAIVVANADPSGYFEVDAPAGVGLDDLGDGGARYLTTVGQVMEFVFDGTQWWTGVASVARMDWGDGTPLQLIEDNPDARITLIFDAENGIAKWAAIANPGTAMYVAGGYSVMPYAQDQYEVIAVNADADAFCYVTLPAAADPGSEGRTLTVVKVGDLNTVTVRVTGSGTIDGDVGAEIVLTDNSQAATFGCYNGDWHYLQTPASAAVASLTDVDLTGLADGDGLVWDATAGNWIPAAPGGGGTNTGVVTAVPDLSSEYLVQSTDRYILADSSANGYWFYILLPMTFEEGHVVTVIRTDEIDSNGGQVAVYQDGGGGPSNYIEGRAFTIYAKGAVDFVFDGTAWHAVQPLDFFQTGPFDPATEAALVPQYSQANYNGWALNPLGIEQVGPPNAGPPGDGDAVVWEEGNARWGTLSLSGTYQQIMGVYGPANFSGLGGAGIYLLDASAEDLDTTLPPPSPGLTVILKRTDDSANTLTILPNTSETIDGAASIVLDTQYQARTLVSDGTDWWLV